jgi:hypothetical protein
MKHKCLEQTFISHCDFVSEVLFQLLQCVMFVHVHFGFQVCPPHRKKTVRLGSLTHLGNMTVTQPIDSHVVYAEGPSK